MASHADLFAALDIKLQKYVDPTAPEAAKLAAAKGLLPLTPKDLVPIQAVLSESDQADIKTAAVASLRAYPDNIIMKVMAAELPAAILHALAPHLSERPWLIGVLQKNRIASDDTIASLVPNARPEDIALLLENQERLVRSYPLVLALKEHPSSSAADRDRMFEFLARAGHFIDQADVMEAMLRLSGQEREAALSQIAVPEDLIEPEAKLDGMIELEAELEPLGDAVPPPPVAPAPSAVPIDAVADEQAATGSLLTRVAKMNVAQKVKLGLKGNKEVRALLMRDSNRIVAVATIKNPRITEQEIAAAAQNRSINEDIIRMIADNKEWTRLYSVKLALVNNPKTPAVAAMRYLPFLQEKDIRNIAKSKNLPTAIANQARALLQRSER